MHQGRAGSQPLISTPDTDALWSTFISKGLSLVLANQDFKLYGGDLHSLFPFIQIPNADPTRDIVMGHDPTHISTGHIRGSEEGLNLFFVFFLMANKISINNLQSFSDYY